MSEVEILRAEIERKDAIIMQLEIRLTELERLIFGTKKSERFIPAQTDQLSVFDKEEFPVEEVEIEHQQVSYTREKGIEKKPSRKALPAGLKRVEEVLDPKVDTTGMKKIGEEVTETLEYIPANLFVKSLVRPKYVEQTKTGSIIHIADLPAAPLHKRVAGASLLAGILTDKYLHHMPLYRQIQKYKLQGVVIPSSSMNDWVKDSIDLLTPLFKILKERILSCDYLQADETPLKVLESEKKGESHKGYMWVYHSIEQKITLFDYRKTRNRSGPEEMLKNFQGHLQVDGYGAYEKFYLNPAIDVMHCMVHARRYFDKALDNDKARAEAMLSMIQELYAIERNCKEDALSNEEITQRRQLQSVPVLERMKEWLDKHSMSPDVKPKSAIGKAITYMLKRWDKLILYVQDGKLNPDNNPIESSIRPLAIGRKNYLFGGNHEAGKRTGIIYTLIAYAKNQGVNPYEWLHYAISNIYFTPSQDIEQLLPSTGIDYKELVGQKVPE